MSATVAEFANLVLRQVASQAVTDTPVATSKVADIPQECGGGNSYNGRMGLRISSVFVILIGSTFGALFPVIARRHPGMRIPSWAFFFTKYFGSGVIIATAFIHMLSSWVPSAVPPITAGIQGIISSKFHLLTPANEALTNPCLTGPITAYPWAQGISLISVFVIFFVELLAMRLAKFSTTHLEDPEPESNRKDLPESESNDAIELASPESIADPESLVDVKAVSQMKENYAVQLTSIFILEFGIIFHSIFIGLTLAVSGNEFITLYIVLVFHQAFEGLGLGSRLSVVPFPNRWTSYAMALGYGLSTPIAIAVGLGVRTTFDPQGQIALIVNGIFDAISSGILLYTGLVELMAHEFLFGRTLREESLSYVLAAFAYMVLGAALMALLGKWA